MTSSPVPPRRNTRAHRGMALIAVLWIVAALGIIATGTLQTIRQESRMLLAARQEIEAQALGDGAIQIALQALAASNQPIRQMTESNITYRGAVMQIQVMPLNGLIDINAAGLPLLERLFTVAGGVPPDAAQALAQSVVQMRGQRDARGAPQRFEAEEDLLRVPGIEYDLYARLSTLLTADVRGSGRVNPMAAPVEVLAVLAGGNIGVAMQIASSREAGQIGVDTSALDGSLLDTSTVRLFRVQARVPMADGSFVRVSRSVDLNARARDGAPWHTFRTSTDVEPVHRKNS